MFDLSLSEMLVVAIVAVVVIGPKDLPRAMMTVGRWVAKARGMTRHLRAGFDAMIREAEMQELEKKWAEQNAAILRDHPATPGELDAGNGPALPPGHAPEMQPLAATPRIADDAQPGLPLEDKPREQGA